MVAYYTFYPLKFINHTFNKLSCHNEINHYVLFRLNQLKSLDFVVSTLVWRVDRSLSEEKGK